MERTEVSRRLKAARALAGVKVAELAEREPLRSNGITANLIGETERQERDARPMELRVIAEALELPSWFFTAELHAPAREPTGALEAGDLARRLDGLEVVLERIEQRLDAVATASEANAALTDQVGVLQAQMIEVRSSLEMPWRTEGAEQGAAETGAPQARRANTG